MKKHTIKKLALSTETLRNLDEAPLRGAEGGLISGRYSVCPQTCGIACTVRQLSCTCQ